MASEMKTGENHRPENKVNMKKRNLKRHAVPSIFPWNDASPTKQTLVSQEEMSSDSKSETENVESRDILADNGNTTEKLSSEMLTSASLEMENVDEKDINASRVKKSPITQNMPFRYEVTQEPSSLPGEGLSDAHFQEALCVQGSGRQQSSEPNNSFEDIEIDIGNVNETTENVTVKQEKDVGNDIETTESVEVKQENNIGNVIETTDSVEVKQENDNSENSISFTKPCETCGHLPFYSVHSYKNEPNGVNFYTGLETFDQLMSAFNSLGNGVNNLDYVIGPPPDHLDKLEQFCMVLLILSRHREFEDVAMTYRTSTKQVANIFITWIRFMALQWRNIKFKFDRKAVSYYMSLDFNDKYPHTRVIIDANECLDKKPRMLSPYEYKNTVKHLIGIAPNGLITYLSPCSDDSDSNTQVNERTSNDERRDKGLNVHDIFLSHGIKPTLSKKHNPINPDILTKAKKIASKKEHEEKIVRMLNSYRILTQPRNQNESSLSSEITFIVAMLVNIRSNILDNILKEKLPD